MSHALRAEWTKLRTVPSTVWWLLAAVALTVVLGFAIVASVNTSLCPASTACAEDVTKLSLTGVWLGQIAVVGMAVLAITSEYSTGTIQLTLAANPRRLVVLAAKTVVSTAVVVGAAILGVLGSLAVGRLVLPGNGFTAVNGYPPLSLADEPTLRAAVGTVLYLGLVGLLSLGIGTLVRDTAGALAVVLGLLYVFPLAVSIVSDPQWNERLQRFAPMNAGLAVQATTGLDRLPIGPWAGLGVLAGHAGAALLLGAVVFALRDA